MEEKNYDTSFIHPQRIKVENMEKVFNPDIGFDVPEHEYPGEVEIPDGHNPLKQDGIEESGKDFLKSLGKDLVEPDDWYSEEDKKIEEEVDREWEYKE